MIVKTNHPYTFADDTVSVRGISGGGVTVILTRNWRHEENIVYIHLATKGIRAPIAVNMPPEDAYAEIKRHIECATFDLATWVDPDIFDDKPRFEPAGFGDF